ncbi:MAG: hypothetical protein BGO49_00625 [Planctomycetales bacterium 71-10]|nr:MAG: hypothetical protein BGO49_00625 [Planctomycetales bacterium 71-10]
MSIRITSSPAYFLARSGLGPTRVLPTSRIRPIGNPAHGGPAGLPGTADDRYRRALEPADPDGPASRPWPPADA